MSWTSTADVLEALATALAAVTPSAQVSADDVFDVRVTERDELARRTVELSATAATRAPGQPSTAMLWQTTIELRLVVADAPAELGQRSVYARTIVDAELLLDAVYDWARVASEIVSVVADEGQVSVQPDGGVIVVERIIQLRYRRTV